MGEGEGTRNPILWLSLGPFLTILWDFIVFDPLNSQLFQELTGNLILHCHAPTTPIGFLQTIFFYLPVFIRCTRRSWSKMKHFWQGWGAGKFFSGSGSAILSQAAPAPGFFFKRLRLQGAKNTRLRPAPTGSLLLVKFAKIFFSPQTSKVKRQKNIKRVK